MKKIQTFSLTNLVILLVIFIIGIILVVKSSFVVSLLSWIIGGTLVLIGAIKLIYCFFRRKYNMEYDSLLLGIFLVIGGSLLLIFPNIIDVTIRIIFGGWILFSGMNRLTLAFTVLKIDRVGFKTFLITSILMIITGVLILINFYELVGILLIIYSITELVDYIYFNFKKAEYSSIYDFEVKVKSDKKQKKIKKELKDKEAIDAVIEQ